MADVAHDASGPASPKPGVMDLQQASRPDSPDRGKLRVFISYSRDDLEFANQLDAALNACGFECFIDRHGISGGEDWKRRLGNLMRGRHGGFRALADLGALQNLRLGGGGGDTTRQAYPSH